MKTKFQHATIISLLLFVSMAFLAGCATTGMQRAEKTGDTMETVEQDIKLAVAQIYVTEASLQELIKPGQLEEKKAFEKYSDDVDKMESLGEKMFKHIDKMSAQGKDYFAEWRKQGNTYTNSEIQALSEQRRADVSAALVKIPEASVGVKGAFKSYMSDIMEIRKYLSNDLTPKGVESITPVAQKAITDGNDLKEALTPVLSAIGTARAELSRGGAQISE